MSGLRQKKYGTSNLNRSTLFPLVANANKPNKKSAGKAKKSSPKSKDVPSKNKVVVEYEKRSRGRASKKKKDWDDGLTQIQKENYDKAVLVYNKAKYEFYHSESLKVHNGWRVPELFVKLKDIRFNGHILKKYRISYINNDIYVSNKEDSSVETDSVNVVVKTEVISPDEENESKKKINVITPQRASKRVSIDSNASEVDSDPSVNLENDNEEDDDDDEWDIKGERRLKHKKVSKEDLKKTKKYVKKRKTYQPKKKYIKKRDRVKFYNDNHAKLHMMNANNNFTIDDTNLINCAECDSSVDISHFTKNLVCNVCNYTTMCKGAFQHHKQHMHQLLYNHFLLTDHNPLICHSNHRQVHIYLKTTNSKLSTLSSSSPSTPLSSPPIPSQTSFQPPPPDNNQPKKGEVLYCYCGWVCSNPVLMTHHLATCSEECLISHHILTHHTSPHYLHFLNPLQLEKGFMLPPDELIISHKNTPLSSIDKPCITIARELLDDLICDIFPEEGDVLDVMNQLVHDVVTTLEAREIAQEIADQKERHKQLQERINVRKLTSPIFRSQTAITKLKEEVERAKMKMGGMMVRPLNDGGEGVEDGVVDGTNITAGKDLLETAISLTIDSLAPNNNDNDGGCCGEGVVGVDDVCGGNNGGEVSVGCGGGDGGEGKLGEGNKRMEEAHSATLEGQYERFQLKLKEQQAELQRQLEVQRLQQIKLQQQQQDNMQQEKQQKDQQQLLQQQILQQQLIQRQQQQTLLQTQQQHLPQQLLQQPQQNSFLISQLPETLNLITDSLNNNSENNNNLFDNNDANNLFNINSILSNNINNQVVITATNVKSLINNHNNLLTNANNTTTTMLSNATVNNIANKTITQNNKFISNNNTYTDTSNFYNNYNTSNNNIILNTLPQSMVVNNPGNVVNNPGNVVNNLGMVATNTAVPNTANNMFVVASSNTISNINQFSKINNLNNNNNNLNNNNLNNNNNNLNNNNNNLNNNNLNNNSINSLMINNNKQPTSNNSNNDGNVKAMFGPIVDLFIK